MKTTLSALLLLPQVKSSPVKETVKETVTVTKEVKKTVREKTVMDPNPGA